MIADGIKHIDPARRSGLPIRTARWRILLLTTLIYYTVNTFLYIRHAVLMGSPLSPRQRYVRQQSDQADNQVFPVAEFCISPGGAGQFICFRWYFIT